MADKKLGRPFKFESAVELERKCNEYFESCWEEDWRKVDGEWQLQTDRNGSPIMKMSRPYSITGLALYLGTSRKVLAEYEERNDDLSNTIKRAKAKCENFIEEGTITGNIPAASGIFALKNYGWTDKQEIVSENHNVNENIDIGDKIFRKLQQNPDLMEKYKNDTITKGELMALANEE